MPHYVPHMVQLRKFIISEDSVFLLLQYAEGKRHKWKALRIDGITEFTKQNDTQYKMQILSEFAHLGEFLRYHFGRCCSLYQTLPVGVPLFTQT